MSNPFETFRKNRNFWMAGLVLLALLAFVVAPAIETMTQGFRGGTASKAVVVRWNGGQLSMRELQATMQMHGRLVRFLSLLARKVMERGGRPQVPGFYYDAQSGRIYSLGIQGAVNEVSLAHTRILADHARRMGVHFSDESADDFLRSFCDAKLTGDEVQQLLYESSDGMLSLFDVREMLKEQMLAKVATQMATAGVESQPPGRTWRDFLKLNQTAKVEAFPVFVSEYLEAVKQEPSDAEIQAIYDEGIGRAQNSSAFEPAFLRRPKASAEYIQANLDAWTEAEKANLTEEELRAEYDRRVSLGQLQVPASQDGDGATEAPDVGAEVSELETTGTETTGTDGSDDNSAEPAAAESDAGSLELDAGQDPVEVAPSDDPTSGEPRADDQAASLKSGRLVAYQQEPTQAATDAGDTAAGDTAAGDTAAGDTDAGDTDAGDTDAGDTDAGDTAGTQQAAAEPAAQSLEPTEQGPGTPGTAEAPTMRVQTFEEARDRIATDLAMERARPAMQAALSRFLNEEMLPYSTNYRAYISIRDSGIAMEGQEDPPIKPNLKRFAEENNFVYGETGLVDSTQLGQTPFGLSFFRQGSETVLVANALPNPGFPILTPVESNYFDQTALFSGGDLQFLTFLFWKTEQRPAYAPELSEIRNEVVDYWKQQQATKLAIAAAERLVAKVQTGDENAWANALSETEQALVVETDPFTWMNRQGGLSPVPKLDAVGQEFMEAVFSTPAGGVGVAPNANHRLVYAFRVTQKGPSTEELRDRFSNDPLKTGPITMARMDSEEMKFDWFQNLLKDYNVVWEIPIEQLMSE
jgi:hypothetical protein